jgi:hypothetical protein
MRLASAALRPVATPALRLPSSAGYSRNQSNNKLKKGPPMDHRAKLFENKPYF